MGSSPKITPLGARKDAAVETDERDPRGIASGPAEGRELAGAVLNRGDRDGARYPVTSARSPRKYVMRIPIGLTIISSGSTVSKNVNCSERVQRSRATSEPATRRHQVEVCRRPVGGGLIGLDAKDHPFNLPLVAGGAGCEHGDVLPFHAERFIR